MRAQWTVILAAVAVLGAIAVPASAGGPLDGMKFSGETGKAGEESGDAEEFVFADGQFDPLGCHEWGFWATPYTATEVDGEIRFVAEHTNDQSNRMKWEGVVDDDFLSGTMWYWEGDQPAVEYWFEATLESE